MKRLTIIILAAVVYIQMAVAQQVTYQKKDSLLVSHLLQRMDRSTSVLWIANKFLGIPYVAHTLEVNDDERLVVNVSSLDCTTFVETVVALRLCAQRGLHSWDDYVGTLRLLRYRHGVIDGYPSRLHYFSDWIRDNTALRLIDDIQKPNPPFTAVQKVSVSYMSSHPNAYKALKAQPALIPVIRQQEDSLSGLRVRYIPKGEVRNTALLRSIIHNGDILAITTSKTGLDIAHLGFAVWRKDGLHLLNASQLRHKVVVESMTLRKYLSKHPSFTGIRVVRVR